ERWTQNRARMQVGAHDRGPRAGGGPRLGRRERVATAAVADVEHHAALQGRQHLGPWPTVGAHDAVVVRREAVSEHVAGTEVVENQAEVGWSLTDMSHDR